MHQNKNLEALLDSKEQSLDVWNTLPKDSNWFYMNQGYWIAYKYDPDKNSYNKFQVPHRFIRSLDKWVATDRQDFNGYSESGLIRTHTAFHAILRKYTLDILGLDACLAILDKRPIGAKFYNHLAQKYFGIIDTALFFFVFGDHDRPWERSSDTPAFANEFLIDLDDLEYIVGRELTGV